MAVLALKEAFDVPFVLAAAIAGERVREKRNGTGPARHGITESLAEPHYSIIVPDGF